MAADLVDLRVAVIAATGTPVALTAKVATATIPIASLTQRGGDTTGINFFVAEFGSKQLGLLHELVPTAARVGLLVNPTAPPTEVMTRDVTTAAKLSLCEIAAGDQRDDPMSAHSGEPAIAVAVR